MGTLTPGTEPKYRHPCKGLQALQFRQNGLDCGRFVREQLRLCKPYIDSRLQTQGTHFGTGYSAGPCECWRPETWPSLNADTCTQVHSAAVQLNRQHDGTLGDRVSLLPACSVDTQANRSEVTSLAAAAGVSSHGEGRADPRGRWVGRGASADCLNPTSTCRSPTKIKPTTKIGRRLVASFHPY